MTTVQDLAALLGYWPHLLKLPDLCHTVLLCHHHHYSYLCKFFKCLDAGILHWHDLIALALLDFTATNL